MSEQLEPLEMVPGDAEVYLVPKDRFDKMAQEVTEMRETLEQLLAQFGTVGEMLGQNPMLKAFFTPKG